MHQDHHQKQDHHHHHHLLLREDSINNKNIRCCTLLWCHFVTLKNRQLDIYTILFEAVVMMSVNAVNSQLEVLDPPKNTLGTNISYLESVMHWWLCHLKYQINSVIGLITIFRNKCPVNRDTSQFSSRRWRRAKTNLACEFNFTTVVHVHNRLVEGQTPS